MQCKTEAQYITSHNPCYPSSSCFYSCFPENNPPSHPISVHWTSKSLSCMFEANVSLTVLIYVLQKLDLIFQCVPCCVVIRADVNLDFSNQFLKKEKFSIVHRLCRFLQEGYIYIQGPILIAQVQQQTQRCTSWVHAHVGVPKCSCFFWFM